MEKIKTMTQNEWIISWETGVSSKTMWAAINGVAKRDGAHTKGTHTKGGKYDVPYDPSDLKRCVDYLLKTGLSDSDLIKVKEVFPWYAPFIDNWGKLMTTYYLELHKGVMPETYDYIQKLEKEAKMLDGWVEVSPGSWRRDRTDA